MADAIAHQIIRSYAPVRICDLGGWTDTWFSWQGVVTNIAVDPGTECIIRVRPAEGNQTISIYAENFREKFPLGTGGKFGLIEAAVQSLPIPKEYSLDISVFSEIPPGASMGTSASVLVALIGALDLLTPGRLTSHEIARLAHNVEVTSLQRQSGVQDQIASSFGGINFIEIVGYPVTNVSPLSLSNQFRWELESRLITFFLGVGHDSSKTHEQVIQACEEGNRDPHLAKLREIAIQGKDALLSENLQEYGRSMQENLAAQRSLHQDLVGTRAKAIIDIANNFQALGVKVNGAGGEGGSVTVLAQTDPVIQREMTSAILSKLPEVKVLPTRLNQTGLRRWIVEGNVNQVPH